MHLLWGAAFLEVEEEHRTDVGCKPNMQIHCTGEVHEVERVEAAFVFWVCEFLRG